MSNGNQLLGASATHSVLLFIMGVPRLGKGSWQCVLCQCKRWSTHHRSTPKIKQSFFKEESKELSSAYITHWAWVDITSCKTGYYKHPSITLGIPYQSKLPHRLTWGIEVSWHYSWGHSKDKATTFKSTKQQVCFKHLITKHIQFKTCILLQT